jgi:hypothetical protein
MIYCLVPEVLAAELLEPLRAHYGPRSDVTVIVDRRKGDPCSNGAGRLPAQPDRRRAVVPRRLAEDLPPAIAPHAASLWWSHPLPPVRRGLEHADLTTLLELISVRHEHAWSELYWRYANRVAARVADAADEPVQIEDAIRRVFGHVFDHVHEYAVERGTFEAFVDAAADSLALGQGAPRA